MVFRDWNMCCGFGRFYRRISQPMTDLDGSDGDMAKRQRNPISSEL